MLMQAVHQHDHNYPLCTCILNLTSLPGQSAICLSASYATCIASPCVGFAGEPEGVKYVCPLLLPFAL